MPAVLLVPVDEVLMTIRDGRIIGAKTVAAVLYWHSFVRKAGA